MRRRWPPDTRAPSSPTGVARPSGRASTHAPRSTRSERGEDVAVAGLRVAHADVAGDRRGEQVRLLAGQAHALAEVGLRDLARVPAADRHAAGGRVHEAHQRVRERRLAGAAGADDGHARPRRQRQRDAVDDRRARLVAHGQASAASGPSSGTGHGVAGSATGAGACVTCSRRSAAVADASSRRAASGSGATAS